MRVGANGLFVGALLLAMPVADAGSNPAALENRLQDVQVGEHEQVTRIALVCRNHCPVTQRRDGFVIDGLETRLAIDLAKRSTNASRIEISPLENASLLRVRSDKALLRSHVDDCLVRGAAAICIDLEFSRKDYQPDHTNAIATAPPIRQSASKDTRKPVSAKAPTESTANLEPTAPGASLALRDLGAQTGRFAGEVAPPSATQPTPEPQLVNAVIVADRGAVLRPVETGQLLARVDFREHAETILDQRFDRDRCDKAQTTLRDDAWALDAMLAIGYCRAAEGDFTGAEEIFRRLLTQDSKNYQAMIGRALIAGVAGEKSVARKFLTEAISTKPPAAISDRLAEMMQAL